MDKIILKDRTEINMSTCEDLSNIVIANKTIDELEEILTNDNLSEVKFCKEDGSVYGKYTNLELVTMSKNYINKKITIGLKEKVSAQ